jgi:YHS domain-containing protein
MNICYQCKKEIAEHIMIKFMYRGKCFYYCSLICIKKHILDFIDYEKQENLFEG